MSRNIVRSISGQMTSSKVKPLEKNGRQFSLKTRPSKPQNLSNHKYNVGLIGCGRIAGVHLKNVLRNNNLNLKWIMEENKTREQEVREQFLLDKSIPFLPYSQRASLMADKSLDAVVIASPTPTHAEYICDSLKQGKGVFSEKPIAETWSDIKTCYETAEKYGRPLLSGFMKRFDESHMDVKELISAGSLGDVHVIKATTRDSPKPSYGFLESADNSGCTIFADLTVHDIDMLVWLTNGRRPESIYVNCHINDPVLLDCGEPDTLAAVIKYPDGVLVTMDTARESVYGYDIRLEVFGTKGVAIAENPRESSTIIEGRDGGSARRLFNSFPERFEKAYEMELSHFVDCLAGTATPLITKEESLCVAEIIEKGIQSYKLRQVVGF